MLAMTAEPGQDPAGTMEASNPCFWESALSILQWLSSASRDDLLALGLTWHSKCYSVTLSGKFLPQFVKGLDNEYYYCLSSGRRCSRAGRTQSSTPGNRDIVHSRCDAQAMNTVRVLHVEGFSGILCPL